MVRSCLLITLVKCLKGHKSPGSLCSVVKPLIVSGARATKGQTMSPIELFWTAKKQSMKYKREKVAFRDRMLKSCRTRIAATQKSRLEKREIRGKYCITNNKQNHQKADKKTVPKILTGNAREKRKRYLLGYYSHCSSS